MRKRRKQDDIPSVIPTQLGNPRRAEVALTCMFCWQVYGERNFQKQDGTTELSFCLAASWLTTGETIGELGDVGTLWLNLSVHTSVCIHFHICLHHQDINDFINCPLKSTNHKDASLSSFWNVLHTWKSPDVGQIKPNILQCCFHGVSVFLMSSEYIPFGIPTFWV